MQSQSQTSAAGSRSALFLASAWIAIGALFKLFLGTPGDLPATFVDFGKSLGLGKGELFRLAIAIELVVVWIALVRPQVGWMLVALQYSVFLALLGVMIAQGAKSCGCMGSKLSIHPGVMLGIDGTLLGLLLLTRPWNKLARPRAPYLLVSLGSAAVVAAVFWRLRGADQAQEPLSGPVAIQPGDAAPPAPALPEWMTLEPDTWIGRTVDELPLASFIDLSEAQVDATWIFYRINCDHCAQHFLAVHNGFSADPKQYVLVRLPEENDEATRTVDEALMPPGAVRLEMPRLKRGYDIQTPWDMQVTEGRVASAKHVETE